MTLGKEKTLKWLARYGLISNTLHCPECQNADASLVKYNSPDGFIVKIYNFLLMYPLIKWRCNSCRYAMSNQRSARFSVRHSSFFSNTQLSIHQVLRAAYYWSTHPSSTLAKVQTETNIHSVATIIDYYNFFRDMSAMGTTNSSQ